MDTQVKQSHYGKDTFKKGYEVVMARGQSDLNLSDAKMFNFLLHRSYRNLNSQSIHKVPVKEVLQYMEHTSISRLENSLRQLGNIKIEIDYHENGEDHSVSCHYLSYDVSKAENGVLSYAFDPILLKFLWEPKIYARINMRFFQQFKTPYGSKLYEIMSFYQHRFHRTWTVSVEELRERFGLDRDHYTRFDNLKRAVISKAVNEVNALASFGLEVEYVRGGRGGKVVEVKFTVVPKSEVSQLDTNQPKKTARDPNTVDLLDGQTDAERGSNLVVSYDTIEAARNIIQESNMDPDLIQNYLDDWRFSVQDLQVSDPDMYFLRWLQVECSKQDDEDISMIDDDIMSKIIAGFD